MKKKAKLYNMYDVLDICKYIIIYCNEKSYAINNLKLQSILYFIQVLFIDNYKQKCFKENLEAHKFGAVVPKAYFEYKYFEGINIYPDYINLEEYDDDKIKENHKQYINDIINIFAVFTASYLAKSVREQAPYKKAFQKYENKIICIG